MAISETIWRFQCDPAGNPDPLVQVFTKETTVVDGETFEKLNMTPTSVPFSELAAIAYNPATALAAVHAHIPPPVVTPVVTPAAPPPVATAAIHKGTT